MTDHSRPPEGLAARTIASLRTFFEQQNHHPSDDHWLALQDVAETMEDMADRACDAKVFLSAVDPGVGKTQTVTHFARALTSGAQYRDVGMIVCVGRIAEAVSLANDLGLPRERFAVLTADDDANALGNPDARAAQVLITTQQRIERVCEGRAFADVAAFHYGRYGARQVRVWDESWLPGCMITVTGADLLLLNKPLLRISPRFAKGLRDFAIRLDDYKDGDAVDVPDFEAMYGVSMVDVIEAVGARFGRLNDDQQTAAVALRALSGKRARVRLDDMSGNTVLTYRDTLPADLSPMIVLDASGRVRETYRYIEEHRGTIVRLREAVKDYAPLQVNVWRKSGSKTGFLRHGDELVAGVIETILTKPDEDWLVVTHQAGGNVGGDIIAKIRRGLPLETAARVRALTWGNHMATNQHADVPNLILAGTLFMRHSQYTALTHLGQDRDVAAGLASPDDVKRTERGEHANLVLQALCRGRVRKSDGNKCLPMTAYVIAATTSGIPDDLATIFPGCVVKDWRVGKRELTGRQKEAMRFIAEALMMAAWVSHRDVARGIGMDWKNYKRTVCGHRHWAAAMSDSPFIEADGPRRARGVRMKAAPAILARAA